MNYEVSIQSNGSCTINELEHEEHDDDLNLGRNWVDKETLTMLGETMNSGEHGGVSLANDGYGSNSRDPNQLTSNEHLDDNVLGKVEKSYERVQSSSPPNEEGCSSPIRENSSTTAEKGKGLKKWRRIRRDIPMEVTTNIDLIKVLKRGSPIDDDLKERSDASVSSNNAIVQTLVDAEGFGPSGSSSSYIFPVNTTFSAGVDFDYSEDRSSKSSISASVPKYRHDAVRVLGSQRENYRVKNVSGRNMGMRGPRSQAGKGVSVSDTSKKVRDESRNIELENSLSSIESNSRDPEGSGKPTNDDDVDDDDEPVSEEHSVEEVRGDCKDRSVSQESSSDGDNAKSENHNHPRDCDPLVNSIMMLHFAQAALEKEIRQFGDIGKGIHSFCEDLGDNSSTSRGPAVCTRLGSESNHVLLNTDVQALEKRLAEVENMIKGRESKISELEVVKGTLSPVDDIQTFQLQVEAEVEYVAMTRSNEELSALVVNNMTLLKEQKTLVREILKSSRTAEDEENKAIKLQDQLKEVGVLYKESTESEEIQMTRRKVVKLTKCLFVQFILLFLVFGTFLSQFSPKSHVGIPT